MLHETWHERQKQPNINPIGEKYNAWDFLRDTDVLHSKLENAEGKISEFGQRKIETI